MNYCYMRNICFDSKAKFEESIKYSMLRHKLSNRNEKGLVLITVKNAELFIILPDRRRKPHEAAKGRRT